jgi:tetratricopeptide (TPR) repeat protein
MECDLECEMKYGYSRISNENGCARLPALSGCRGDMSSSTPDLAEQAAELRKSGNVDDAIILARRAIEIDPNDPDAWWQLGLAVETKDGAESAILYFEKTIELANGFAYGWFKLGNCQKQLGQTEEALRCFEKALALDDDRTDALGEVISEYQKQSSPEARVKLIRFTELLDKKGFASSHDINLLGKLFNDQDRKWHSVIYSCKPLLNFLTRGDIRHFLADETYSPLVALCAIEADMEGFERVIGGAMAAQFDYALTAAISASDVDFIEALLDGRRWVGANQEDLCFEGSVRAASKLLASLRNVALIVDTNPVTVERFREVLEENDLAKIIALLPQPFQPTLEEVSSLAQDIAISTCNDHGNKEAAKQLLDMVRPLLLKSASLVHSIDEGRKALDELIAEDNKHDASLTYGGQDYTITRKSVSFQGQILPVDEATSLRWGVTISGNATTPAYSFVLAVSGKYGPPLSLSWTTANNVEKQRELFDKMSNAAMHYILPKVLQSIRSRLAAGEQVQVGAATLTESGVLFPPTGWFSSKLEHVEWPNIRSRLENGNVILTDMRSGKVKLTAASLRFPASINAVYLKN